MNEKNGKNYVEHVKPFTWVGKIIRRLLLQVLYSTLLLKDFSYVRRECAFNVESSIEFAFIDLLEGIVLDTHATFHYNCAHFIYILSPYKSKLSLFWKYSVALHCQKKLCNKRCTLTKREREGSLVFHEISFKKLKV